MNRKKKVKDTIKKWTKKANAKNRLKNKPRYISKADREKMALEETTCESSEVNVVGDEIECEDEGENNAS